jgi:hypothetical protein
MATRHTISRLSGRIDKLATRLGVNRSRPVFVYGPTRAEAERNGADYLALRPEDADRPMQYLVTWAGEPLSHSSEPIHVSEIEKGTWVTRPSDHGPGWDKRG